MSFTSQELTLIGTLSGVLIGGIVSIFITLINKRSEEQKHKREIIIKAAIESWKESVDLVKLKGGSVEPLDVFIIHLIKLSEVLLNNKKLDSKNIIKLLKEIDEVTDLASEYRNEEYKKKKSNIYKN